MIAKVEPLTPARSGEVAQMILRGPPDLAVGSIFDLLEAPAVDASPPANDIASRSS